MMGNGNNAGFPVPSEESYDIRIARDGSWWHEGHKVERMGLVKLFASVLKRDDQGDFWLITPAERGRIRVEDAPFVAVEMRAEGTGRAQRLSLRTNLDEWVTAGADHPLRFRADAAGETKPYVEIRDGLEAVLNRSVYYQLAELGLEEGGIWSDGEFFRIPAA